jgi:predicted Fe-Mo cluster-binding NifX family protein
MIAITVVSPDLKAELDPRFGRAPYVLLVDPGTLDWTSLENPGRQARGGAGIRLAQLLNDRKVDAVISGRFGPKATDALEKAGITMHSCEASCTAKEAISLLKDGKLGTQGGPRPLEHPGDRR